MREALLAEWLDICAAHRMDAQLYTSERVDKRGRQVFIVHGTHGHHESFDSHDAALERFVDSFRTRVEDLEETHRRAMAANPGLNIRGARKLCQEIGSHVRANTPPGDLVAHDAGVLAEIARLEALQAAEAAKPKQTVTDPKPRGGR